MTGTGNENGGKVIGIGFHKTGTTTLGAALERLGYKVCHGAAPVRSVLGHRRMMDLLINNELAEIMKVAGWYDAFEDNPWFVLFRELDQWYPGSRFILTVRDEGAWIESVLRYYGESQSDLRHWIYGVGTPVGNEAVFQERYRRHNEAVMRYFAARPADLLVVDWEKGDGWNELGAFLGRRVSGQPFPHENRRVDAR